MLVELGIDMKISEIEFKHFVDKLRNNDLDCSNVVDIHGILGIAGETGELVGIIKKSVVYHEPINEEHLKEELGDLLHYMMYLLSNHSWTLGDLMTDNVKKLKKRYPNGYSDKDAVERKDKLIAEEKR